MRPSHIDYRRRYQGWAEAIQETQKRIAKVKHLLPTLTDPLEIEAAIRYIDTWTGYICQGERVMAEDLPKIKQLDAAKRVEIKAGLISNGPSA